MKTEEFAIFQEDFLSKLMTASDQELLEDYAQYHCYCPEDLTPEYVMDFVITETKKEILSRMKSNK